MAETRMGLRAKPRARSGCTVLRASNGTDVTEDFYEWNKPGNEDPRREAPRE